MKAIQTTIRALAALFLLTSNENLCSYEPYQAILASNTAKAKISEPNLVDLSRSLKTNAIESILPLYTPTTPILIDINLRGIISRTSFPKNSTTLFVEIPQAGISKTFTGATRDDSIQLYKDYIRDGGKKHRLLKAYAKYSPIDPIAGNPNSLMAQMAQADYLTETPSPLNEWNPCINSQLAIHQFQLGMNPGRAFSKKFDTTIVTLPIRYSYSSRNGTTFILDAPFTYNRNGGASSAFGSLALALRTSPIRNWSLTSIFRAGSGGSFDLCTSGCFISTGFMSVLNYQVNECLIKMTNYVGYVASVNLWLTGINFNYHLNNYIFKNGLSISSRDLFYICNKPLSLKLSFVDTYFSGNALYINHYDEISFSLFMTSLNPYANEDCLSVGFSYQFGKKDYKGYFLNITYQY